MNKTEARFCLLVNTFFGATQYVFLAGVPSSVSQFAFLFITSLTGFLITLTLFRNELFRLDKKQVLQCLLLAGETLPYNLFLMMGTSGTEATVSSCVSSAYFVFVPLLTLILFRKKPEKNTLAGIAIVLAGLFLMMNAAVTRLMDAHILYLLAADMFFALYLITAGHFTTGSNPAILTMVELFFRSLFALVLWTGESLLTGGSMTFPTEPAFWGAVLFTGLFVRGMCGVLRLYAQRYVSPLQTSLIFSTQIIMTMAASPALALAFGTAAEQITPMRVLGAVTMIAGILLADAGVFTALKKKFGRSST